MRGESEGTGVGVYGESKTGTAVSGLALAKTGYGIRGENKVDGTGIFGVSSSGSGIFGYSKTGIGVRGENNTGGNGVSGFSSNSAGVLGKSQTGEGVRGEGNGGEPGVSGFSSNGPGVLGKSQTVWGVRGEGHGGNAGVEGVSDNVGVTGSCRSETGMGVWGVSSKGEGVRGTSFGGVGVYAYTDTGHAIWATATTATGYAMGIRGRVVALSEQDFTIQALNNNNYALKAESENGVGIFGRGGKWAGEFLGNVKVTGQINPAGADVAEEFDTNNIDEPGTVMVINNEGTLEPSCIPYDKRVTGIASGAGGYKPGIVLDTQQERDQDDKEEEQQNIKVNKKSRLTVALVGKVYCKVDATVSPIEIGDMLTTSSTRGHAMKADEPSKAFGTVIGKALQPLRYGKGLIPVLVGLL